MTKKWIVPICLIAFLPIGLPVSAQSSDPLEAALREALQVPDSALRFDALQRIQGLARKPQTRHQTKSLVPDVTGLLRRDPNPGVRREAVRTLEAIQSPEARVALHLALGSPDSAIRYEAVRGLGNVGDQSSFIPMRQLLRDPVPYVRLEALRAIGALTENLRKRPAPSDGGSPAPRRSGYGT